MTDELPILDESALAELRASVGGDDDFMRDLIGTFLADEPANLELVAAAAARGDADAIIRPAHTLKSSAAVVGAARLSAICRRLETAGREGRTADLVALTEEARTAWTATVEALRAQGFAT